jgi:lambda family phage minor tail protein L
MTTSLSVASIIEKNRLSSEVPWLILLDIVVVDPSTLTTVETLNLARNPDPVTYNGATYAPAAFDIELKSQAGEQQTISLSIKDYTLAVQQRMQDYGGGVGFNVSVMVVNAGNLTQSPEVIEYFQVVGAETANYICTFTLGAENNITKSFPRRRQTKDYCQWRYKGQECGYTGSMPSCDLSLKGANGCEAHQNVVHFGAFPGINSRDTRYG